jgi:hypothetical protein
MREITSEFVQKSAESSVSTSETALESFYGSIAYLGMTLMGAGYCPNCNVQMERTNVTADGAGGVYIETERGGMLDRLGVGHRFPLSAPPYPECGVMQRYTDRSE